ncbi:HAMP domain-containing histidine kinase [Sedimentibacter sp. zth1]|uniref:HAMP domain-containing sensor histidine kinase n=1 Tax=Sedimentibacter sp. zth1 TaxID=2816908 RepID=UPI001A9224BD|nr:HAMP domain-containing sensor histidine kinase [Sedimentibacter sp. zth1]QSX05963.1 HAMP domain-containing histidine kinase [Sedimentibacter sp. zth1]
MATKLKKINRSIFLKIVAYLIIIICSFTFILLGFKFVDHDEDIESIFQKDFLKSYKLCKIYRDYVYRIKDLMEDNEEDLDYSYKLNKLKNTKGMYFYVTNGVETVTNVEEYDRNFFMNQKTYLLISDNDITINPKIESIIDNDIDYYFNSMLRNFDNTDCKISIAFANEFIAPLEETWAESTRNSTILVCILVLLLLISTIAFIYLVITTGKKATDELIHLNYFDRLFTDFNLIIIILIISLTVSFLGDNDLYDYFMRYVIASVVTTSLGITILLHLSLVRHMKNGTLIKKTLIYTVLHKIHSVTLSIFNAGSLMVKSIFILAIFTTACIIGTLFFPLIFLVFAVAIYFVYVNVQKFIKLRVGVNNIKDGNLKEKIYIKGNGELAKIANNINSISEGLEKAVYNEVKSERLKTELISNVSHDIKTPLTSIINYVDLLKRENIESENAKKYLNILDNKSQRLKILTADLFEAAKATSGNMPVNFDKVDVYSLIQQGLGELEDKVEKSKLIFKLGIIENKIYVKADGRLLWRVIENLFSNVFKYALGGSRVYIDFIDNVDEKNVAIIIKNISSYELNVEAEELMERFKRADESRNTEGSGLGLAIAKNLLELQNGELRLEIDGDLFKAIVLIPKYDEHRKQNNSEKNNLDKIK